MTNPNLSPPFISRHCPSPHFAASYFLTIIHPLIASHLLAATRNAIVVAFIELLSGSRFGFSSPRDTYQHRAAAFNECLRSCSGFDLKVSHRLSSPCCSVYHLTSAGNIVTAISELLRFVRRGQVNPPRHGPHSPAPHRCATPASSRFANNNNNNDALVPATKNINRPSMVVNVKVLKKLFSVNNFQKKPRRRIVKNVASQSLEVKKLMYLYLLHYAEKYVHADLNRLSRNQTPLYDLEGQFERINQHPNAGGYSFSIGITEVLNTNLVIELSAKDVEYIYLDSELDCWRCKIFKYLHLRGVESVSVDMKP
ncbi:hypothetical protein HN51_058481 [Arachis hypogaea]